MRRSIPTPIAKRLQIASTNEIMQRENALLRVSPPLDLPSTVALAVRV